MTKRGQKDRREGRKDGSGRGPLCQYSILKYTRQAPGSKEVLYLETRDTAVAVAVALAASLYQAI